MSEKKNKFLTFKDYLTVIYRLKKIGDDLDDIDKSTGGILSKEMDKNEKMGEELEVSDSGYSQKEIEELLNSIETNAQDALLSDDTSKREKKNAVETIRWIRSVRPKFDSGGKLSADSMKKLMQLKRTIFDTEESF